MVQSTSGVHSPRMILTGTLVNPDRR